MNNYKRFKLIKGDIIMARTCSPGINYFVREDLVSVFNNGLVRIRANNNKVYPIFLYQLFKTRDFIGEGGKHSSSQRGCKKAWCSNC